MTGMTAAPTAANLLEQAATIADGGRQQQSRLSRWFATVPLPPEVAAARAEAIRSARGLPIAALAKGPALGLRWFPPGVPTSVHDHGGRWGVTRVLEGRGLYETWSRSPVGSLRCSSVREVGPGDVVWFDAATLHRQEGLDGGALELVLLERAPEHHLGDLEGQP